MKKDRSEGADVVRQLKKNTKRNSQSVRTRPREKRGGGGGGGGGKNPEPGRCSDTAGFKNG